MPSIKEQIEENGTILSKNKGKYPAQIDKEELAAQEEEYFNRLMEKEEQKKRRIAKIQEYMNKNWGTKS